MGTIKECPGSMGPHIHARIPDANGHIKEKAKDICPICRKYVGYTINGKVPSHRAQK